MKCPACKKRLKLISPAQTGEYICDNEECPERDGFGAYPEFYGMTQSEIDANEAEKEG